jgi:hypothetical protein
MWEDWQMCAPVLSAAIEFYSQNEREQNWVQHRVGSALPSSARISQRPLLTVNCGPGFGFAWFWKSYIWVVVAGSASGDQMAHPTISLLKKFSSDHFCERTSVWIVCNKKCELSFRMAKRCLSDSSTADRTDSCTIDLEREAKSADRSKFETLFQKSDAPTFSESEANMMGVCIGSGLTLHKKAC